jgi:hypothetical protein
MRVRVLNAKIIIEAPYLVWEEIFESIFVQTSLYPLHFYAVDNLGEPDEFIVPGIFDSDHRRVILVHSDFSMARHDFEPGIESIGIEQSGFEACNNFDRIIVDTLRTPTEREPSWLLAATISLADQWDPPPRVD